MTGLKALDFCNKIDSIDHSENYKLMFSVFANTGTVEPFGMLLTSAKIRQFIDSKKNEGVDLGFGYWNLNTYAAHMGFYKSCRLDIGNLPGQASGSSTYLPLTCIPVEEVRKESEGTFRAVGHILEIKANQLSKVLSRGNEQLQNYLTYSIREIMRNVVEHSRSKNIWIAAQYWEKKGIVEVAILDEGVGVKTTLSEHPMISVDNDEDALKLALEPAVTGNRFAYGDDDTWANSGYGLFMTSSICKNGGDFIICSGENALLLNDDGIESIPTSFKGTAIRMRIHVPRIGVLQDILHELSVKGAERADRISSIPVKSASLVSKMLVDK